MERAKLPEETVERLLKCQRWGVCDQGTADICNVNIKTVHRFQRLCFQRAQEHHRQVVDFVKAKGVQLDEAYSKLRKGVKEWIHTALAMGSLFLLWVEFGPRTQDVATRLVAQVVARLTDVPKQNSDQLRIRQGVRPAGKETFAGTFVGGPDGDAGADPFLFDAQSVPLRFRSNQANIHKS